ncbi:hypothetical protein B0T09DRAFT_344055 [Sordaria sp. MPI-SDFR-AT-0083]|nr:hypothetical protein B0T09DRAFT_344055 [Sordaria sp. MPI-SDFR-AT-0083]
MQERTALFLSLPILVRGFHCPNIQPIVLLMTQSKSGVGGIGINGCILGTDSPFRMVFMFDVPVRRLNLSPHVCEHERCPEPVMKTKRPQE